METDSQKKSQDGADAAKYLADNSSKARSLGRSTVFAIIATSWTLAYSNNIFHPIPVVLWSLALAIIYVFLDLLHYVIITTVYKYILINYFDPVEGGFVYKQGKDASSITRVWMNVGFWWIIVMSLILLLSSLLIILYVLSLAGIMELSPYWVSY